MIGYSNIARKRFINTFIKSKIPFCVASKSFKGKIKDTYKQFNDYNKALKQSGANIVYLSLPNSMHFYWSKMLIFTPYPYLLPVKTLQNRSCINF